MAPKLLHSFFLSLSPPPARSKNILHWLPSHPSTEKGEISFSSHAHNQDLKNVGQSYEFVELIAIPSGGGLAPSSQTVGSLLRPPGWQIPSWKIIWAGTTKDWKYHCTVGLLFDWFGVSCMTTVFICFNLQNRLIQTSQTGGQWYSDTSPFSIPWSEHSANDNL